VAPINGTLKNKRIHTAKVKRLAKQLWCFLVDRYTSRLQIAYQDHVVGVFTEEQAQSARQSSQTTTVIAQQ
jgi:hypothetical protein